MLHFSFFPLALACLPLLSSLLSPTCLSYCGVFYHCNTTLFFPLKTLQHFAKTKKYLYVKWCIYRYSVRNAAAWYSLVLSDLWSTPPQRWKSISLSFTKTHWVSLCEFHFFSAPSLSPIQTYQSIRRCTPLEFTLLFSSIIPSDIDGMRSVLHGTKYRHLRY